MDSGYIIILVATIFTLWMAYPVYKYLYRDMRISERILFFVVFIMFFSFGTGLGLQIRNDHLKLENNKIYAQECLKKDNQFKIVAINTGIGNGKYAKYYYETIAESKDGFRISVNSGTLYPAIGEIYEVIPSEDGRYPWFTLSRKIK